jgi:hypothetical protein
MYLTYTVAQFKVHKKNCNALLVSNALNCKFDNQAPLVVVVSDLTYVRVNVCPEEMIATKGE